MQTPKSDPCPLCVWSGSAFKETLVCSESARSQPYFSVCFCNPGLPNMSAVGLLWVSLGSAWNELLVVMAERQKEDLGFGLDLLSVRLGLFHKVKFG